MRADARPVVAAGGVALVLAVVFLVAPPLGTDLSAQVARAEFVRAAGFTPVDLRWYGGTVQFGYSLVAPAVLAVIGVRLTGVLAAVVSALALAELLRRTSAPRPVLGAVLGALCCYGNLVSGRVTYGLGVAFGLLGLLALTVPWPGRSTRWPSALRRVLGAIGVALAAATSPVAGLFAGLAGVALAAGVPARRPDGVVVAFAAAVPLGVTVLLSDADGWMNISVADTVRAGLTGVVVALVVSHRVVRIGALLSTVGVIAAFAVHTPVGLNATRLATMFALPVVAGYARLPAPGRLRWPARLGWPAGSRWLARPRWLTGPGVGLAAGLVALVAWQPPVLVGDLRAAGDPTASRRYFAPLLAELAARGPVGRVEIVPTRNYWEAAHAARVVHLARGWLRQADLAYHPVFFDGSLSAPSYERWLRGNGVSYVALADAPLSWVGRPEAALIRGGLPYLTVVWRGSDWTLYEVAGRPSMVEGGELVATGPATVTLDAHAAGEILVRVRYSGWLRVDGPPGGRLRPAQDGWTRLSAPTAGRYTIGS